MSRAVRSEHAIAKIAEALHLSVDAKLAIENAIDPFPDTRRPTRGWPDAGTNATVTPRSKQSVTVSQTGGYTQNWDAHIFCTPVFWEAATTWTKGTMFANTGVTLGAITLNGTGSAYSLTGLNIFTTPTGVAFDPSTWSSNPAAGFIQIQLQTPSNYITDSMRAISSGIEIHNTTPELYRGGTIICYRQPMNSSRYHSTITVSNGTGVQGAMSIVPLANPPPNASSALALADSTQWNAAKGAYLPMALQTVEIPYNASTYVVPSYYKNTPSDTQVTMPFGFNNSTNYYTTPRLWTEFAMSGAILQGLDPKSSLTVNWNTIYEIQAAGQSTLLENIATPSPARDSKGLDLIFELVNMLPVAVEVDRNGLGDWISSAAGALSRAIMPTMKIMAPTMARSPHPATRIAGMLMSPSPHPYTHDREQHKRDRQQHQLVAPTLSKAMANRERVGKGNKGAFLTANAGNIPKPA